MATKRRGGAPKKATGGLDRVLYVRADAKLVKELEVVQRRTSPPGSMRSIADVVRSLLWDAIYALEEGQDGQ